MSFSIFTQFSAGFVTTWPRASDFTGRNVLIKLCFIDYCVQRNCNMNNSDVGGDGKTDITQIPPARVMFFV